MAYEIDDSVAGWVWRIRKGEARKRRQEKQKVAIVRKIENVRYEEAKKERIERAIYYRMNKEERKHYHTVKRNRKLLPWL